MRGVPVALVEQQTVSPPAVEVEPRWAAAHRDVSTRLAARYGNRIELVLVEAIVARHFGAYVDARITLYVPVLVERAANDELRRHLSNVESIRRL